MNKELEAGNIFNEFELKAGVHIGTEERLIIQAIQKGIDKGISFSQEEIEKLKAELKENQQISDRISTLILERDDAKKEIKNLKKKLADLKKFYSDKVSDLQAKLPRFWNVIEKCFKEEKNEQPSEQT